MPKWLKTLIEIFKFGRGQGWWQKKPGPNLGGK